MLGWLLTITLASKMIRRPANKLVMQQDALTRLVDQYPRPGHLEGEAHTGRQEDARLRRMHDAVSLPEKR